MFGTPYEIFRIELDHKEVVFYSDIFIENVEFDVSFPGRWFAFEDIFRNPYMGENKQKLDDFRKGIYSQFKAAGCDKAYYFPDQGYGQALYDLINLPSAQWVAYMQSREYIKHDDNNHVIIKMSDYIAGKFILRADQNIICIVDYFSDMKN